MRRTVNDLLLQQARKHQPKPKHVTGLWTKIVKVIFPAHMFAVNAEGYHGPRKVQAAADINFGTVLSPLIFPGDEAFVEKDRAGKWWATKIHKVIKCFPVTAPTTPNIPLPQQALVGLSDFQNFSPFVQQLQPFPPDFIHAGIITPLAQMPPGMGGTGSTIAVAPVILGVSRIYNTPSQVNAIATDGKYIYAVIGTGGSHNRMVVVDVSDPNNPIAVANVDLGTTYTTATPFIGVVDNIVTVGGSVAGQGQLVLVFVDHSTAPPTLTIKSTTNAGGGVAWYDVVPFSVPGQPGKFYVGLAENSGSSGLRVYEITNPAAPVNTGNLLNAGWQAEWITFSDGTIFLHDFFTGTNTVLHSIDVTTPGTPALLQTLNLVAKPDWRIRTTRTTLLAPSNFNGAWVLVNVSNPSAMTILQTVSNNDIGNAGVMNGAVAYGGDGFRMNAYSTTGTKLAAGVNYPSVYNFFEAAFHGNHAFLGGSIFINPNTYAAVGVMALPGS